MTRARTLVWLIALAIFAVPSYGAAAASHAMAQTMTLGAVAASVDCHDPAPPPKPCPEQGTAKHAASQCCPLMAGVVAPLPPATMDETPAPFHGWLALPTRHLSGLTFTQDPPPPRV